jgi:phage FluMu protein Com
MFTELWQELRSKRKRKNGSEKEKRFMQKVNCTTCGKLLCEAVGEVKKICPRCKNVTHVVVTSKGIIDLNHAKIKTKE